MNIDELYKTMVKLIKEAARSQGKVVYEALDPELEPLIKGEG